MQAVQVCRRADAITGRLAAASATGDVTANDVRRARRRARAAGAADRRRARGRV